MIQIKGGNGSTKEKAIRIIGADTELKGIDVEFNYIERLGILKSNHRHF